MKLMAAIAGLVLLAGCAVGMTFQGQMAYPWKEMKPASSGEQKIEAPAPVPTPTPTGPLVFESKNGQIRIGEICYGVTKVYVNQKQTEVLYPVVCR